jgi:Mn-containing catalase
MTTAPQCSAKEPDEAKDGNRATLKYKGLADMMVDSRKVRWQGHFIVSSGDNMTCTVVSVYS